MRRWWKFLPELPERPRGPESHKLLRGHTTALLYQVQPHLAIWNWLPLNELNITSADSELPELRISVRNHVCKLHTPIVHMFLYTILLKDSSLRGWMCIRRWWDDVLVGIQCLYPIHWLPYWEFFNRSFSFHCQFVLLDMLFEFLGVLSLNSKLVCCKFNRRSGSKESRGLHRIQTCEVPVLNWNMDGQLGRDQGASYPAPIVFPEEYNGKALKVIVPI